MTQGMYVAQGYGLHLRLAAALVKIAVIGGRIVSFFSIGGPAGAAIRSAAVPLNSPSALRFSVQQHS